MNDLRLVPKVPRTLSQLKGPSAAAAGNRNRSVVFFHLRIMTVLMQHVCGQEVPVCSDSVALVAGWGGEEGVGCGCGCGWGGFAKYG